MQNIETKSHLLISFLLLMELRLLRLNMLALSKCS
jgi:hypothetical protein